MGQRALDDPRNMLVKEFVRLVAELDANYFVFENVKGLTVGKHRVFLEELIKAFAQVGYQVEQEWRVLNAANYGVPQDRQRLFLLGAKTGLPVPSYPKVLTAKPGTDPGQLPFGPTCKDALDDLPDAESFKSLWATDAVATTRWGEPSDYARNMRCTDGRGWFFGYERLWDSEVLTASMRTEHSEITRRRFSATVPGEVEPVSRFFRLPPNGVSNTLRAGTDAARGAFTSPRPIHYKYPRCITVREMARLHGFPDWFRFHETKWHGARQIGNAVPPPMARAVATQVMLAAGLQPMCPPAGVELGNVELIRLDMSQASEYWGVPNPIGKRNMRSGIRKRSQADIEAERLTVA
jgi:DNA (cytosine-5)-methyltransferase 1